MTADPFIGDFTLQQDNFREVLICDGEGIALVRYYGLGRGVAGGMFSARTYPFPDSYRFSDIRTYPGCQSRTGPHSYVCTGPDYYADVQSNSHTLSLSYSYAYIHDTRSNVDTC